MRILIVLLVLFVCTCSSFATIINVPDDFETIQAAIDTSQSGDTVLVSSGTYLENINFNGKNITVASHFLTTGDESYLVNTIIDGDSIGAVVTFENEENENAILIGFAVRNGYSETSGGGIECRYSSPTISDCLILNNYTLIWGGGISFDVNSNGIIRNCEIYLNSAGPGGGGIDIGADCNPVISDCYIHHNEARFGSGGGMIIYTESHPLIENCVFYENTAEREGGAIWIGIYSNPIISNCQFLDNMVGYHGGAIAVYDNCMPLITGCLFEDNETEDYGIGDAIAMFESSICLIRNCTFDWEEENDTLIFLSSSNASIINSSLYGQETLVIAFGPDETENSILVAYSDVSGGEESIETNDNGSVYWEDRNIDADPMYVDLDDGDYNLRQNSPCIDAGTAFFVWQGDTLINLSDDEYNGEAPDIGAYESNYQLVKNKSASLPEKFMLSQNYPNPFNSITTISIGLPAPSELNLSVYNITGQKIAVLAHERFSAGYHQFTFNADGLSTGIYFIHANVPEKMDEVRRIVYMK
ncbi:MAG: right-handed parallel beta-helix repeat-containing protein [Candidatus Electryonea clarkiae]|nr:right-handed parallel beta-helix repeat-containing protein [Candidatus Electryonea clarkiae]MDP8287804.1 right-handed parallel beta-helix repeat-containing protein [Candidatus Electryonea clarkiae]